MLSISSVLRNSSSNESKETESTSLDSHSSGQPVMDWGWGTKRATESFTREKEDRHSFKESDGSVKQSTQARIDTFPTEIDKHIFSFDQTDP